MDLRSEQLLNTVHVDLGILAQDIFHQLKDIKSPINFKITYGRRSAEEQNKLFKLGKSFCDGYKRKSKHQTGKAIDFMASYEGKNTFEIEYYYYIASLFQVSAYKRGIKIKWGGFFKRKDGSRFIDGTHIELV